MRVLRGTEGCRRSSRLRWRGLCRHSKSRRSSILTSRRVKGQKASTGLLYREIQRSSLINGPETMRRNLVTEGHRTLAKGGLKCRRLRRIIG